VRVPEPREQFQSLAQQTHAARLGMWMFVGSESLLFAGLIALYVAYRVMYGDDFAMAIHENTRGYGTLNTFVLITSSFTVALALGVVRAGRRRLGAALVAVTVGLGAIFLVVKGFEYAEHVREGALPGVLYHYAALPGAGARLFFTLYWFLTGLHALHVTGGLCALSWIGFRTWRDAYSAAYHTPLELTAIYWHLVDIIWIFLWPLLYLMD
jgi:cytochrome c oxidase subunit 3